MCDYDDYEDDGFMDDDPFNNYDDESPADDLDDNIPLGDTLGSNEFTATDAFFIGGAMGWAYEEGLTERHESKKRRKRKRDDYDDFI